jgi:hypothetical protein
MKILSTKGTGFFKEIFAFIYKFWHHSTWPSASLKKTIYGTGTYCSQHFSLIFSIIKFVLFCTIIQKMLINVNFNGFNFKLTRERMF